MNQLFFSSDGINFQPLGEVKDMTVELENTVTTSELITIKPAETSFELKGYVNKFLLFELFTGIKITNNYLKMHGGVIQRHVTTEKYRNKRRNKK